MPKVKSNTLIAVEWLWSNRGKNIWWTPGVLSSGNPDPTSPKLTDVEAISVFKLLNENELLIPSIHEGRAVFLLHEAKDQEWNNLILQLSDNRVRKNRPKIGPEPRVSKTNTDRETKLQWWVKALLGSGGLGAIVVALIALFNHNGGHTNSGIQNSKNGIINGPTFNTVGNSNTINNSTTIINPPPSSPVIPQLPFIRIESLDGLPEGMTNDPNLRLNRVDVRNINDVAINNFCSRLQLPEAIASTTETDHTTGTQIGWRPLIDKLAISGTGGRTEGGLWIGPASTVHFVETHECFVYPGKPRGEKMALSRGGDITGIWELTIDKLPPGGFVTIMFITSKASNGTNYADLANVPLWQSPPNPQSKADTNELRFSLEGEYFFEAGTKPGKQNFLLPIVYDPDQRKISSSGIQSEVGHWRPVTLMFQ